MSIRSFYELKKKETLPKPREGDITDNCVGCPEVGEFKVLCETGRVISGPYYITTTVTPFLGVFSLIDKITWSNKSKETSKPPVYCCAMALKFDWNLDRRGTCHFRMINSILNFETYRLSDERFCVNMYLCSLSPVLCSCEQLTRTL